MSVGFPHAWIFIYIKHEHACIVHEGCMYTNINDLNKFYRK